MLRTRYIFVIASLANTYMIGPVLTFVKAECRERHRTYMHMKTNVYLSIYTLHLQKYKFPTKPILRSDILTGHIL